MRRYETKQPLSYSAMVKEDLSLLRAATRYLGSWQEAVEFSGLDYAQIRKYRSWTNERIVDRIRELWTENADLSWRNVSLYLDPSLAAAATKKSHFGNWRAALDAAGLDYDAIRKYRDWSDDEILRQVRDRYAQGRPLNAKSMEKDEITLITAARRRFPSWDRTLTAAGLDYRGIVQRAPFTRRRPAGANAAALAAAQTKQNKTASGATRGRPRVLKRA